MQRINSADKRALRVNLCNRFGGRCAYCLLYVGMRGTVDHYLPQALGGTNAQRNLRWCCLACNGLKKDMHPDAWERVRPPPPPPNETRYERKLRLLSGIALKSRLPR